MDLEDVQKRIRAHFPKHGVVRRLDWMRISERVMRADDYEIHRSGAPGQFTYELFKTPFYEKLWGPCETAQEAMEQAALHQVLL